jgi:8-amino-7-oxononanoate synthase
VTFNERLESRLRLAKANGIFRELFFTDSSLIDFASNDYLGLAKLPHQTFKESSGSTGSRLLTGNSLSVTDFESDLASFCGSKRALTFGSGYAANLSVLSTLPEAHDLILYDEYAHASIRDGIRLGFNKSYKFRHNDLDHLFNLAQRFRDTNSKSELFIVTETLFSMDGDGPNLEELFSLGEKLGAILILDEAHAFGVHGLNGEGLSMPYLDLIDESRLIRVAPFGKSLGSHGGSVLGSNLVIESLINFARPFKYTTAPGEALVKSWRRNLLALKDGVNLRLKLQKLIKFTKTLLNLPDTILGPIIPLIIGDSDLCRVLATKLKASGILALPVVSPTVPKGRERLRISLHSYNEEEEVTKLNEIIKSSI